MSQGYFSNQTQSRFLANAQPTPQQPQPPQPPLRTPRRTTSKHFSTSLSHSSSSSGGHTTPPIHPLRHTWVFYFREQRAPGTKLLPSASGTSYEDGIKRVASFASVESFWGLHTHLTPPSVLIPTTDYLLFHAGIARPVWEDPANIHGGKWVLRVRKGVADRIWESLVCAVVGDGFAECRGASSPCFLPVALIPTAPGDDDPDALPEICGCTISVRASEDIISLWNRVEHDPSARERIRDTMKHLLGLPPSTTMEYKSNNDSIQDTDRNALRSALSMSSLLSPV
ncbi:Translation initiation factor eIF4e [Mycena kentingensis (nom. inval.)]|nr:Translation initiation factor eIF4e [Mycena kentingensis (nom. inval.)]